MFPAAGKPPQMLPPRPGLQSSLHGGWWEMAAQAATVCIGAGSWQQEAGAGTTEPRHLNAECTSQLLLHQSSHLPVNTDKDLRSARDRPCHTAGWVLPDVTALQSIQGSCYCTSRQHSTALTPASPPTPRTPEARPGPGIVEFCLFLTLPLCL